MRVGAQLESWVARFVRYPSNTDPTIQSLVNELYTAAYREGFADGWTEGNEQGYKEGLAEETE